MATVIPFNPEDRLSNLSSGEEARILSERHKDVLKERLTDITKIVTSKDLPLVKREVPLKINGIRSKRDFVNKMISRARLLYDILFDEDSFHLPRAAVKTILAGLMYFISSNDFIEDNIPGLGYLDDAYVISMVFEKVRPEIRKYLISKHIEDSVYM